MSFADIWMPVRLTLALATINTLILLVIGTVIDGVSALVPFRAALDLITAALAHGPVVGPLAHLLVLAAAWSVVGWWGVRRTMS